MARLRLALLILTALVVGVVGTALFLYARGYRLNPNTLEVSPNGLLVIKSNPEAAQVFLDGELKTATNATIPLAPGTYDVSVRKEGYFDWNKRLSIQKEIVTEATAHLFRTAPSLSAITFSGVANPSPSADLTKLAYVVPQGNGNFDTSGLWVMETLNLPLGFAREPRRITDGDLADATYLWSPDARQILLKAQKGTYLLDTSTFTSQTKLVNVSSSVTQILAEWEQEKEKRLDAQIKKLPGELQDVLTRKASAIIFSADEDMILYTASDSGRIADNLIKPIPGASTQKQEREIKEGKTYIYDIKEDRNFFITDVDVNLGGWIDYNEISNLNPPAGGQISNLKRSLFWYPSSRHVILAEEDKITIMDYDGTNKQIVYSGSYVAPHVYPTLSLDRLLILTNLGANAATPNLYSLSIK